jgi:predicted cupin superfamily sugar epimerase
MKQGFPNKDCVFSVGFEFGSFKMIESRAWVQTLGERERERERR